MADASSPKPARNAVALPDDLESAMAAVTEPSRWLVTGVAGFIGSHLLHALLERNQEVRGLDNLSTGRLENLEHVKAAVSREQWSRFEMRQGDISDETTCREACQGITRVLHQAALGSVPGSLADPDRAHAVNVTGTLHLLKASQQAGVGRFVYASSCAVYGDLDTLPLTETVAGHPLSPYAATKQMNELYAEVWARCYGLATTGLRYFNVFGPRQDPNGAYAAVIPRWVRAFLSDEETRIYGDGLNSRDFCYVADVVQANLRAALVPARTVSHDVFNVGLGRQTHLLELHELLRNLLAEFKPALRDRQPCHGDPRPGDIRHSRADISRITKVLGFRPLFDLESGLRASLEWYRNHLI